ncbi:MAG: aromatic ring-hydroxylating dioxygenase subunit alpha [Nevskiaceae bacterium]|nr:MAG: aromatic ring-hydroxylating dioxygenase subunit alpha [Nevskiaceae bacterium]TBR72733.1 MAG: aromatic ring-hydroxylating dioxygenase subunit alpha [Nevskiaceae bacterium]
MDTPTAEGLLQRTVAALHGARPEGAEAGGTLPVTRYTDAARTARERRFLRTQPQPVAASSDLPAAGSWLTCGHLAAPLLLVRQADGTVRAFLNVCRHRGARVAQGCGRDTRHFTCPYHAWTYGCDGTLERVPQAFGFPGLDLASHGLRRLAACEHAGLVWVVTDPATPADTAITPTLQPFIAEIEALDLQHPVAFAPRTYEVAANWKLLLDGAFEAYHFKIVHRDTIAALFVNNLQIVDEANHNRRLFLPKANLDPDRPPPATAASLRRHGNLLYFLFPNTTLLVQPDHAQFSTLEPLAPDRTRVHEITLLPAAPDGDKARAHWQANVELYRRTLGEDYAMAESIQAGLASGANDLLTFATFEFSAPHFHADLEAALEAHMEPA